MEMRRRWLAPLILFLAACPRARSVDPKIDPPRAWQVRVSIPADLDEVTIEASIDRAEQLMIDGDGARFVHDLQPIDGAWRKTNEGPWGIACSGPCRFRYRFALHEAAVDFDDPETAIARGGAVAAPISTWLLRPAIGDEEKGAARITVVEGATRFASSLHVDAARAYVLPFSDLDETTFTVFGDFRTRAIPVGASSVDLAIFPQDQRLDDDDIARWIGADANAIANGLGRFPVDRLLLVAMNNDRPGPTRGVTLGGGGASIVLRIGNAVDASKVLSDDWVVTHEMVHVGSPELPRDELWFSEGLASYIEPFWRARAGMIDADKVWRDLVEGMPQGEPQAGDHGLDGTQAWGRVYWGGAMFCLLADLEIREKTSNARALDDALRAVTESGGSTLQRWSFERFLDVGDAATGTRVLHDLYARMAHAPVSVDLPALWKKLGVEVTASAVTFDDAAPLGGIRRSMTARRP